MLIRNCRLPDGRQGQDLLVRDGRIASGSLTNTTVEAGATVSGTCRLLDMVVGAGAVVTGGDLRGFTLAPGQQVQGGTHTGPAQAGMNPALMAGAMMFMPGLAPLLFMPGGQQMLQNAASGFGQLANGFLGKR